MPEENLVKRILPHSLEAEQSMLGAMLYSEDAIMAAMELNLQAEDFYNHQNGMIFRAIMELQREGKPADIVNVQDRLRHTEDVPPEVSSLDFLKNLLNAVFTAANAGSYAKIIAEKATLRRLIRATDEIANDCYLEKEPAERIMEQTEKKIFDLLEKRQSNRIEPVSDIVLRVIDRIEEASKNGGKPTGLPTGFTDLDRLTNGMQPSDLILFAGRPSMGKTAFVLNLADNFAVRVGVPTVIFEMEMSRDQLINRMLSMESHVDSNKLRTGSLSEMEWDDLVSGSEIIAGSNLIIDDTPGISLPELRSRCRKYKLEYGIKVIIVDYLQLMSGNGRNSESRQQEVSEISRGLKAIARELDVPLIACSQLSRAPEARSDHRPMLADLRESGAIEQDADLVMFIYRDEVYNQDSPQKGTAEIILAKQRNGAIGTVRLKWIAEQTRFTNLEYGQHSGE
ncbi:MAG: replicative DNA helicase [Lachnospiraceae bacterium]|nr:replicative DNA helicase [Lachnospiraceae bacterium]